jgi:hypothetical protein
MSIPDTSPSGLTSIDGISGEDHALAVLLEVRTRVAPDLPEDLLRQCYAIQKQFQFDRDEQLPVVHTRKLIEAHVEREAERAGGTAYGASGI